jgi:hypothetical protein
MKTQVVRPHTAFWLLLILGMLVMGFLLATVRPAAQTDAGAARDTDVAASSESIREPAPSSAAQD